MKNSIFIILLFSVFNLTAQAQTGTKLSYCYDELTAPDFVKAVGQS